MTPAVPAVRYRVGRVIIDPGQRSLVRNGETQHIRERVFRLFMYLAENRNRIVSKEELVERVWDGVALSDSVLYKTILELRRLLEENSDEPALIKTVPKVGYQFKGILEEEAPPTSATWIAPSPPNRWKFCSLVLAAVATLATGGLWLNLGGAKPLPEGEVAWWRMDESAGIAVSDVGGRNSGRLIPGLDGVLPHWSRGRMGNALAFDGGGGYAEGPFPTLESPASICLWVKLRAAKGNEVPILDSPKGALLIATNGLVTAKRSAVAIATTTPVTDDRWHHLALVDEGSYTRTMRLFVDGTEEAAGVWTETPTREKRWRVGRFLSGGFGTWGLMDDLRIYGRPLRTLELESLYRCGKEQPDIVIGGRGHYYLPVFQAGATVESDGAIRNPRLDFSGVQVAVSGSGSCGVADLRGADLGQDLRIETEILVPKDANGRITHGGPYFRSRAAYPGDGLAGGTSSGNWVKLSSTGEVTVWQLNPYHPIATSQAPVGFNSESFHRVVTEARGRTLRVWIDGQPVTFQAAGYSSDVVQIETTAAGHGTAGVAFGSEPNRGLAGGQQARIVRAEALR